MTQTGFETQHQITLHETDAAGRLFFSHLFTIAHTAYEQFAESLGFPLHQLIPARKIFVPVVHAEADYLAPILHGDPIKLTISVTNIGAHSFSLHTQFLDTRETVVSTVQTVHVCIDPKTGEKVEIPGTLQAALERYHFDG